MTGASTGPRLSPPLILLYRASAHDHLIELTNEGKWTGRVMITAILYTKRGLYLATVPRDPTYCCAAAEKA